MSLHACDACERTLPSPPSLVMAYRTPNYTHEQKLYFLQRIQGVVDTVQDFRKDTNTTIQRNAVWNELLAAFNAAFPDRPPSTMAMLKTLWKRMKVETRAALIRRQEQVAAGAPLTPLTEIQREVTSMVPNLMVKLEGADHAGNSHVKPERSRTSAEANSNDHEDVTVAKIERSSPEHVRGNLVAGSSSSSLPEASQWPPSPAAPATPTDRTRGVANSSFEARMLELSEMEHQQKMRVLLAQEHMLEEKRRALRQKEKAYRYKKKYYQTKLQKLGTEVESSTDED
ncbi:fibrinogen silencer-binding protein [Scleropages formosus]|uniref:fibrinogen silencer-binding protein n=1 Tax=Scleropages formosus TaxID=113540 RepID=UPI0010FABB8C|nr:fibrinogen silencer-binding protein [Scleropages formosus]